MQLCLGGGLMETFRYCSHCFEKSKHRVVNKKLIGKNIYECLNCKEKTVQCSALKCNNMARKEMKDFSFCAEHNGSIAKFENLDLELDEISDFKQIFEIRKTNYRKYAKISFFVVGGMLLAAPLAFAGAEGFGGVLGNLLRRSKQGDKLYGKAASNAGLALLGGGTKVAGGFGIAGGICVLTATGTALGGAIGGVIGYSYFNDIEGFDIVKVKSGVGANIIFINGFLNQDKKETYDWEKQLKRIYPNNPWYYVKWESKRLMDLGQLIIKGTGNDILKKSLLKCAKKATKKGAKKAANGIAIPLAIGNILKNPWHVAMFKAQQTGVLLADLIARTKNQDFILVGHSLGARVIHYTLNSLATKEEKFIEKAHLLGGAVGSNNLDEWKTCCKAVSGNVINYYSSNDLVLKYLYRYSNLFVSNPIGYSSIDNSKLGKIVNNDVSHYVKSHFDYIPNLERFIYP